MCASHLSCGLALVLVVGGVGCGGGGGGIPDGGRQQDGAAPDAPPVTQLVWRQVSVDDQNAGHQVEMASAPDGSLGVAYFRKASDEGTCTRMTPPPPVSRWEVVYAGEGADGTFTPELAATVDMLNIQGLALAFDSSGKPAIAFMGGAEGQYRCGGSDIMLARRSAANGTAGTWAAAAVDNDGMGNPVFTEDEAQCVAYQNTCRAATQDVVGPWPGLAFAGTEALVTYRDIHFGFAQDDEEKADLELARGAGGFSLATLDSVRGGGFYTRMVADDAGNPVVAHYNPYVNHGGIWVQWQDATAAWQRTRVVASMAIGYKLGFARDGTRLALSYYPKQQSKPSVEQRLWYVEAPDGVTWGAAELVDAQGDTGRSPSLAFDPAGRPAIAYYRCRDQYNPNTSDCDPGKDGVKYAVKGAAWESVLVWNDGGVYDGQFVSLAFDRDGLPAIAYQATYVDTGTSPPTTVNELIVARSRVQ